MQPPLLRWQRPRPCSAPAAAAPQAPAPPPRPPDKAPAEAAPAAASAALEDPLGLAEELDEEVAHLCMELASLGALPAAEEAALLGLGPSRREVEEEAQRLFVELASLGALPAAEEAALLGLPAPLRLAGLPQPLLVLRCRPEGDPAGQQATFYILGTAHVSEQSCRDAAALVRAVRPQFVFLELCKERAAMLGSEVRIRAPTPGEAAELVRSGKATPFSILYSWVLAKVGADMQLDPGAEFRAALLEARAVGARYVLGDRPISVTMARTWAALSGWEKARLLGSLLWTGARSRANKQELQQEIERLKGSDALTQAVGELARDFPGIIGPLVTERDLYMVYVLRKLAAFGDKVVAVVGAGHLAGIREHWEDEIRLEELMRVPERK